MRTAARPVMLGTALVAGLALAACGAGEDSTGGAAAAPATTSGQAGPASEQATGSAQPTEPTAQAAPEDAVSVVAAFYPLQFLAERVGGDRVEVTGLTPPGAEAHDLELTPQALAGLTTTDLVVVLDGFQPAVDEALAGVGSPVVDLGQVADREYGEGAEPHDHSDDEHAAEHADEHADDEHGHDGGTDPHFWTDPTHMAEAAGLVAQALSEADPAGADAYAANAEALVAELTALDEEAQQALASCEVTTLVTAHDAFGYFADRYGFEVRSINGLTPDQEPDARALAEISDFVADSDIRTVYTETLVPTAVADTVAAEAGVETMVLDPVEGLTDDSAGEDYLEVMRANIDTVRTGQVCA